MPSYQTMNSKYSTSSSPTGSEEAGGSSLTDSVSSIAAEDFHFLPQSRRRHDLSLKVILHRKLVRLWLYAVSGTLAIVAIIFVFTFIVQPRASISMTSRNFISNNPIETNGKPIDGVSKWLNDFSYSAAPVMCHSHNDYTRPYPLFSALAAGCASVEADVWSTPDGKDLLVGHNKRSLSNEKTLQSLYINPLLEILNTMNPPDAWNNFSRTDQADGVFRTQPDKTLILFIDVKDDPSRTWPLVLKQLEPLREKLYLSRHEIILDDNGAPVDKRFWSGPITVVGTGNILDARFANYGSNTTSWRNYHDAFLDAYLDQIAMYDTHGKGADEVDPWLDNEFYTASVSFWKTIGSVRTGLSKHQLSKLRDQINSAQIKGLKARYWGLPEWPISHRDYVWRVLIREGIDLLNADDVQSAAKRDWSYGYARETVWISIVSAYILAMSVLLLWIGHRAIQNEAKRAGNSF